MLTTLQQQKVMLYLGWPGKTLIQGSTHYNSVIASRLVNLIPEIEGEVGTYLVRIQEIDTILRQETIKRMSTLEIDNIKLNPAEAHALRKERRTLIGELADLLDIDVLRSGGMNIGLMS